MDKILYPPPQQLFRAFLNANLPGGIHVGTHNPKTLPDRWVRIASNGGPRSPGGATWDVQMVSRYYDEDDDRGEETAVLIHQLMMDAAGVDITMPGGEPYPWVNETRFLSGPVNLTDDDLPELELYQSVVVWKLLPIP